MPAERDHVDPAWVETLRRAGLDSHTVWTHPRLRVWRSIRERDNAVLDGFGPRLHVKRHRPARGVAPAELEAAGHRLLVEAGIPTFELAAWGVMADGRSYSVAVDLSGFQPADRLISRGRVDFAAIAEPTARIARALHAAGLHHRDLYLCHFLVNPADLDVRLIDVGRVRRLPIWFARRWIVKDLAQFWFSAVRVGVPEPMLVGWLERAGGATRLRAVRRKAASIARRDRRLARTSPERDVSLDPLD